MKNIKSKDFLITLTLTLAASLAGKYAATLPGLKIIGTMVIALLIGMLYQIKPSLVTSGGNAVGFISGKFLRLGIILLGFKLNLIILAKSGIKSILLALFVVTFMLILTYILCRKFQVNEELSQLTACGCGICGAAAVMGVSPQIKAKSDDSVLAVAVVCIMGTVFTLISVFLKDILPLTLEQYAVLCGASLHEIAHAVAAAGVMGQAALDIAIVTKLSRVLLLAPVAIIIGHYHSKKCNEKEIKDAKIPIPWFMLGFLIASAIGSFFKIDTKILDSLVSLAYILLGMAMAALGMSVNFKVIKTRGKAVFTAAGISSLILYLVLIVIVKFLF